MLIDHSRGGRRGIGYIEVLTAVSVLLISTVFLVGGFLALRDVERKAISRLWAVDGFSFLRARLWTLSESRQENVDQDKRIKTVHGPRRAAVIATIRERGAVDDGLKEVNTSVTVRIAGRPTEGYTERRVAAVYAPAEGE